MMQRANRLSVEIELEIVDPMAIAQAAPVTRVMPDFAAFYDSRRHAMVRLAALLVGSHTAAEEIVQEAFVRVYERWGRLDEPAAYLRVVVVNRCHSWHRRRRVARAHQDRYRDDDSAVHHDRPDEMADALRRLSARRRTVLVLRFYEHLTTAEIAAEMQISESTVRSTLHRGLEQMKGILE
ncbi:MAG: subfamily polymerase sigma-24 subunit [Ilumatobacteraceae bacterium]|nr:subfamily polymerase sigma-24 subunit [Ilumatobacteraceae bacterium]